MFEIDKTMAMDRKKVTEECDRDYYEAVYKKYNDTFDIALFTREYHPVYVTTPQITDADIKRAFGLLGKTDLEKQRIDCCACGSDTCYEMARKIAFNVNIPANCILNQRKTRKQNTRAVCLPLNSLRILKRGMKRIIVCVSCWKSTLK